MKPLPLPKLKERAEILATEVQNFINVSALLGQRITSSSADRTLLKKLKEELDQLQADRKHEVSELRKFLYDVAVLIDAPAQKVDAVVVMNQRFDQLRLAQNPLLRRHEALRVKVAQLR